MTKHLDLPFHVYLQTSAAAPTCLHPLKDDPSDFVVQSIYDVVGWHEVRGPLQLGQLSAKHVKLSEALNAGMSWDDIVDADSQDLCDIYDMMFDDDTGDFTPDFEAALGTDFGSTDICYVPSDEVLDTQWGPHALSVLRQHSGAGFMVVGVSGLTHPDTAQELTTALARAAKLEAMGYTRCAQGPFFFLNTAYHAPELPQFLQLAATQAEATFS